MASVEADEEGRDGNTAERAELQQRAYSKGSVATASGQTLRLFTLGSPATGPLTTPSMDPERARAA